MTLTDCIQLYLIQLNCIKGFVHKKRPSRSTVLTEVVLPKVESLAGFNVAYDFACFLEKDFKEAETMTDGVIMAHRREFAVVDLITAVQKTDTERDICLCEFLAENGDLGEVDAVCHGVDLSGLEGFRPFLYTILAYLRRLVKGSYKENYEQIVNNL